MRGKKTGGIQKGYKYPKTIEFKARCDEKGFVIVDKFIELFNNAETDYLKFQILQEMAKYQFAIPRDYGPLEDTGDTANANGDDQDDPLSMQDILELTDVTPKKET